MTILITYLLIALFCAIATISTWGALLRSLFWLPVLLFVLWALWYLRDMDFEVMHKTQGYE